MPVPDPPHGYADPWEFGRPRWLLEVVALGVFAGFVFLTGLHTRFRVAPDVVQWAGITAILVVGVVHEGCHYAVSKVYGFDPVFELFPPRIYTLDRWVSRGEDLVLLLSPLVVIDIVGLVFWFGPFGSSVALVAHMIVVVNTAVSVPDLYTSGILLERPHGTVTIVVSGEDGITEFVAEPLTSVTDE